MFVGTPIVFTKSVTGFIWRNFDILILQKYHNVVDITSYYSKCYGQYSSLTHAGHVNRQAHSHECETEHQHSHLSFSQTHKFGNIGIIANFIISYVCNFLPFFHFMMLVNVKLDIGVFKKIIFHGCRLHWSS